MDISGIISIAGMTGLYKVVAQSKNGFIVESLIDKKRIPAYSSYKISTLDDITVYSTGSDTVTLKDVFVKMREKQNGGPGPDHKSSDDDLKKFFGEAFPEYDKDRVYISDIRKMISWYNLLQKNDLLKDKEVSKTEDGSEDKTDIKSALEEKNKIIHTTNLKNTNIKPTKTNAPKKTQGVRKTGTA